MDNPQSLPTSDEALIQAVYDTYNTRAQTGAALECLSYLYRDLHPFNSGLINVFY